MLALRKSREYATKFTMQFYLRKECVTTHDESCRLLIALTVEYRYGCLVAGSLNCQQSHVLFHLSQPISREVVRHAEWRNQLMMYDHCRHISVRLQQHRPCRHLELP